MVNGLEGMHWVKAKQELVIRTKRIYVKYNYFISDFSQLLSYQKMKEIFDTMK